MSSLRIKILATAEQYLKSHSLADAQINALCQAAGVSRTSFYREFKNLDDMFSCLVASMWTNILKDIIADVEAIEAPEQRLFEFSKQVANIAQSRLYLPWDEENITHAVKLMHKDDSKGLAAILGVVSPFILHCQQQGGLRQDLHSDEIADWILRQMWMLMSIPLSPTFASEPLDRYIQIFIVDALRPSTAAVAKTDDINTKLDQILDKLRYL
jgi:AcrR family transcriptional regulator